MAVLTENRTALPAGTWALDPIHSTIGFELPYLAGTFRGHFTDVNARLTETGLQGSARVASVDVKDENLAAHLQSPDFFDTERTPEIRLQSTSVERNGDDVVVDADLTIKGTRIAVVLRGEVTEVASDPYGKQRLGLTLATKIDRSQFGLNWNAPMPGGGLVLSNDVKLTAELEFVKAA